MRLPLWALAPLLAVLTACAGRPDPVVRGGLVEVEYTTADHSAQSDLAGRCRVIETDQMSPTHVRYTYDPARARTVLPCLRRSPIVRAVALPG